MKTIIGRDLFFLTGKTSSFVSPVFLNAVQIMTKCGFFSLKTVFLFVCFGSSFSSPLVSFPLLNNIFQLIIHTVVSYFNFFGLYLDCTFLKCFGNVNVFINEILKLYYFSYLLVLIHSLTSVRP